MRVMKAKHLIIFFLANVALRLIAMMELRAFPDFYAPTPAMDTDFYYFLAEMMRPGSPLITEEPYYYFPAYGWFMYLVTALFGDNPYAPRLITALLGSSVPIGMFLIARELIGKTAAYAAFALSSLYGLFIFYDNQILKTSFEIFFITWGIYFFVKGIESRKSLIISGILFAFSASIHTSVMLSVIGLSAYLIYKKDVKGAAVFIAPAVLVLALMGARNYAVSKEFTSVAVSGIHLYTGNSETAGGIYGPTPGIRQNAFMYFDAGRLAEKESGVKGVSPSKHFGSKALRWIQENPSSFAKLTLRKLLIMFNRYDVPNNVDVNYVRQRTIFMRYFTFPSWLIYSLGLAGLALSLRDKRLIVPGVFLLTYGLAVIAFFVNDRYRLPLAIPLVIYSAAFIGYAVENKPLMKKAASSLALIAAVLLVNVKLDLKQEAFQKVTEGKMRASGEALKIKTWLTQTQDPKWIGKLYVRLGELYVKRGAWEQGRHYYYKAFKADPQNEQAEITYYQLGMEGVRPVVAEE